MKVTDAEYRALLVKGITERVKAFNPKPTLCSALTSLFERMMIGASKDVHDISNTDIQHVADDLLRRFHHLSEVAFSRECNEMGYIRKITYKKYIKKTNEWLDELDDILEHL